MACRFDKDGYLRANMDLDEICLAPRWEYQAGTWCFALAQENTKCPRDALDT